MLRSLVEIQDAFGAALVDPERPVPTGVIGRDGSADVRRFAVYRNNVMVGLVEALRTRFPVTERLVGTTFFRAMARVYAAARKPSSPLMIHYGDAFPDFVADFEPARSVSYLADVARLELAWSQAYHAPEASPLALEVLARYPLEALAQSRFVLHPSVRLVRSPYPVATIWAAHQTTGEVIAPEHWEAEDALVLRPQAEVLIHKLPTTGAYAFIATLAAGANLEQAAAATLTDGAGIDLGRQLAELFRVGAVVALDVSSNTTWSVQQNAHHPGFAKVLPARHSRESGNPVP